MISLAARSGLDVDLAEVVNGLLREVLARDDAAARERQRELAIHALEREQVFGRLRLVDDFLASRSPA